MRVASRQYYKTNWLPSKCKGLIGSGLIESHFEIPFSVTKQSSNGVCYSVAIECEAERFWAKKLPKFREKAQSLGLAERFANEVRKVERRSMHNIYIIYVYIYIYVYTR